MGAAERRRPPSRVVLVGATASGKSEVALSVAERFHGEIVGADSRQIYRGLEIGTEAPTLEARARIAHHFVSFLEPSETYSAGRFGREARTAVEAIESRGAIAVVAGGSGLYVRALLEGLFEGPARDDMVRARLTRRLADEGLETLRSQLERIDPDALAGILEGDSVRVIRALEVYELTGRPISALRRERAREPFPALVFGLRWARPALHERIEARLGRQLARGFLDETRRLLDRRLPDDAPGPRTLGYRELLAHLRGETTLEVARKQIALKTRQLAKRQETWFQRTPGVTWLEMRSGADLERAGGAIAEALLRHIP